MIILTPAVLSVLHACVLYFCICTCSAQLSMFHMERRSNNTLFITFIALFATNWTACHMHCSFSARQPVKSIVKYQLKNQSHILSTTSRTANHISCPFPARQPITYLVRHQQDSQSHNLSTTSKTANHIIILSIPSKTASHISCPPPAGQPVT